MRSRALNTTFNRALVDPEYRQVLLHQLRRTLLEAGVPETEVRQLELLAPSSLEELATALETIHIGSFKEPPWLYPSHLPCVSASRLQRRAVHLVH